MIVYEYKYIDLYDLLFNINIYVIIMKNKNGLINYFIFIVYFIVF